MNQEFVFNTFNEFIDKFNELEKGGVSKKDLTLIAPHPIHGFDDLINPKPSRLRYFTLLGAVTGLITGFAFTIYTVLIWPIITGGKPIITIPAFIIIAFELTILFGSVVSFLVFLLLARLPSIKNMLQTKEYVNKYVIIVHTKDQP